ncbi:virulence protein [Erwiniaceae bacterium BAC15a-03b]|uniref:Virulence protein n=1 Tax=Winslowiella arboricola TaxID=2978220 RepID=A0A9J6PWX2_9GAMM|nr:SpvB/TcaC N-terminal domain-containing protein [Winslowiella arboricola]MCU5775374.1 virulence protein [Winslowiella arboricola]MCU5780229.1 virulence protein [Winslowiella arboricola]
MQTTEPLRLNPPSLPSGGGAITGLKSDTPVAAPDGGASLSIQFPVSGGRGYAPTLVLNYHSQRGNGPFGMGWDLDLPSVRRRSDKGVPLYDLSDEFIGPDGEVLVAVQTSSGEEKRSASSLLEGSETLGKFIVRSFRARSESDFSRLEYWTPDGGTGVDFWVLYRPDGQVHLLGRNPQARIWDPQNHAHTAVWLLESSVSPGGEQIYYQYRGEDNKNCDAAELKAHPDAGSVAETDTDSRAYDGAQRYLVAAYYGNKKAARSLPALTEPLREYDWIFVVKIDYGVRVTSKESPPSWQRPTYGDWALRKDLFSRYQYGFDLRTRRLARQVLLFHRINTLKGSRNEGEPLELVSRLLFDHNENASLTTISWLQLMAYEQGTRTLRVLPPHECFWQSFENPTNPRWQTLTPGGLSPLQPWQLVDLNGEGMAGILYQDNGGWWYRAPERRAGNDPDAVSWGDATPLPVIPAARARGTLADLNGDGYLEWVITAPGIAGRYERTPEDGWLHFTPLSALPTEYHHPRAQLADILGAGLSDLLLIGPRSVRLYAAQGDGWAGGKTVVQSADIMLPVPGADARVLVAFSDMAGSGQQQLVEIRATGVQYWPNLGHGRFGHAIEMPGFSVSDFNPDQLYLADIDGSGTTDLIYARSDQLQIWRNQCGNRFAPPFAVRLPAGVRYDRTCYLYLADIQGLGVASLLLTIPHPTPRHWLCNLSTAKSGLLIGMTNNMGARHRFFYRSSAQFWLDEKAAAVATGAPIPPCYLPFAVHCLQRVEMQDEITGNLLVSSIRYRHGAWDRQERELRGFGWVEVSDSDTIAAEGSAKEISMPAVQRNWYATGLPALDKQLASEYWQGDKAAFSSFTPRFTEGSGDSEQTIEADEHNAFWLQRGLRGLLLRSELYGRDGSHQATVPYSVTENRPQVRLVQSKGKYPVVWPAVVVSRTYLYERIDSDPQCSEQLGLTCDEYGQPLRQLTIHYPRRARPATNPWPENLPASLFADSFDEQQQWLRLQLLQSSQYHLSNLTNGIWWLGLADRSRGDVYLHPASAVPAGGLTLELLLKNDSLVAPQLPSVLTGQQQIWYFNALSQPSPRAPGFPPRVAFMETAGLDSEMVSELAGKVTENNLTQAGWQQADYLFPRDSEKNKKLWVARQGYLNYAAQDHFWLPVSYQETLLTGKITVTRTAFDCAIKQLTDASGLTVSAEYNWYFLQPCRITDANDNQYSVTFDALGRVTTMRFSGTENGQQSGYSSASVTIPVSASDAFELGKKGPLAVAQCVAYIADSWWSTTRQAGAKMPPHVVILTTDRYDSDPAQQIRQQVIFNDGFGRVLQVSTRQENGAAWQQNDDNSLSTDSEGLPLVVNTPHRWSISGRTEYDNKGQRVRQYQPFFLDGWKYLRDDSARRDLYADTHYYDATGRETDVKTAKGWLRRRLYTPWCVVNEDENDTAAEIEQETSE